MNLLSKIAYPYLFWIFLIIALVAGGYEALFFGKIYKGVSVGSLSLAGKDLTKVIDSLEKNIKPPVVRVVSSDLSYNFVFDNLDIQYKYQKTAQNAYNWGRKGKFFYKTKQKFDAATKSINLPMEFDLDENQLEKDIEKIAEDVYSPLITPSVSIEKSVIVVNPGRDGTEVDKDALKKAVLESLANGKEQPIPLPINQTLSHLEENEIVELKSKAEKLVGKSVTLEYEDEKIFYKDTNLVTLLSPLGLDQERLESLGQGVATSINRSPQNARFSFESGRVKEFIPAKQGLEVKQEDLANTLKETINELLASDKKSEVIRIPVLTSPPEISTEEVNNLGIKELLGRGTSRFKGSITSRIHNISLAALRLNGLLIKPGETFSFNNALGDVSAFTGYQQAYVIQEGKTVLGDGGGVCQVSTTLFRAALASGLSIIERHPHSYRVGYYEQDSKPGLDATVYSPSVDLKIKNNTPGHILIQANADTKKTTLTFELYGTSDGRVATVSTPHVWDITPAPPTLYQDDPTLQAGTTKQIDFSADGAKSAFDYKVTRGDDVLQSKTFYSTYRPWQAVFLRGTAPN